MPGNIPILLMNQGVEALTPIGIDERVAARCALLAQLALLTIGGALLVCYRRRPTIAASARLATVATLAAATTHVATGVVVACATVAGVAWLASLAASAALIARSWLPRGVCAEPSLPPRNGCRVEPPTLSSAATRTHADGSSKRRRRAAGHAAR